MMMMMMNITGLCCVIEVMHCDGGAVYCVNCGRGGGHMMVAMMIVIMVFRYVDLCTLLAFCLIMLYLNKIFTKRIIIPFSFNDNTSNI